jgi:hypothetical protein
MLSFGAYEEAILKILETRPVGPPISIEEDFLEVRMNSLDMPDIQDHEPTPKGDSFGDRPPLDWNRLYDADDDYDEILFDPNREIKVSTD